MPTALDAKRDYERAMELLERGQPGEARSLLRDRLGVGDGAADLKMLLGVAEFRLEHFDAARSIFREVTKAQPDHEKAHYYVGLCHERQGGDEEAADAFRAALRARPDFELAKKKLDELGASPAEQPSRSADEPRMTEFYLHRDEQELERYAEMREKKERADIWARWRALPLAAKIFQIVFFVLVVGWIVVVVGRMFIGGTGLPQNGVGDLEPPARNGGVSEVEPTNVPEVEPVN